MHRIDREILEAEMELERLTSNRRLGFGYVSTWEDLVVFMRRYTSRYPPDRPFEQDNTNRCFLYGEGTYRTLFITVLVGSVSFGYSGGTGCSQTRPYTSDTDLERILQIALSQPRECQASVLTDLDKNANPVVLPRYKAINQGGGAGRYGGGRPARVF